MVDAIPVEVEVVMMELCGGDPRDHFPMGVTDRVADQEVIQVEGALAQEAVTSVTLFANMGISANRESATRRGVTLPTRMEHLANVLLFQEGVVPVLGMARAWMQQWYGC